MEVPGPGAYHSIYVDKKETPSFGFGSSPQREPIKKTLSQGPGAYKIPTKVGTCEVYALPG